MTLQVSSGAFKRPGREFIVAQPTKPASVRVRTDKQTVAGFVPAHPRFHAVYNRSIGLLALIAVIPIIAVIAIALWLTQGSQIFYAGTRLGKDRETFYIYKFRTLDSARAKLITADKVLPVNSNIETPLGKYLRASRLDELPQLFNIVRGDMNIVGPRPVRSEIAKIEEARNPDYAIRYRVKPGLVGQTQAYMCHGTSKAIRAKYNYMLCVNRVNYLRELALFIRVGLAVLQRAAGLLGKKLWTVKPSALARKRAETWDLKLIAGNKVHRVMAFENMGILLQDRAISGPAELIIHTRSGGLRFAKVNVVPSKAQGSQQIVSHQLEPTTHLSSHLIHRFLIDSAVVGPQPAPAKRALPLGLGWFFESFALSGTSANSDPK